MAPRLYIADPSLKDSRGHHYALTRAITDSATAARFDVIWLCSRSVSDVIETYEGVRLLPSFGVGMYDNYAGRFDRHLGVSAVFERVLGCFGWSAQRPPAPPKIDLSREFEADLAAIIATENIGPDDRLLIHTADGATYAALARLLGRSAHDAFPIFHVVTPYDPSGVMPNRDSSLSPADAISEMEERALIDRKIFLYAENRFLAERLSGLWGVPVRPQELPSAPPTQDARRRALKYRRRTLGIEDDAFLVVSLGSARLEKGFDLFPEIVAETFTRLENIHSASEVKFVLHASPQIVGRHPAIIKAIRKLQSASRDVSLILDPLSDEDYENLLLASDCVMLPYVKDDYLYRGSAIVSEAITAEKILIATEGSYPGRRALEAGGAVGVCPSDFAAAVVALARDPTGYRTAARRAADEAHREHGKEDYLPKLLRIEEEAAAMSRCHMRQEVQSE